ncbi:MAG: hypothetical protein K0V04_35715 [Deltaproteobacteria bacterium]|nr:hypothetical protein [Deltaproteobacteria bacterium]
MRVFVSNRIRVATHWALACVAGVLALTSTAACGVIRASYYGDPYRGLVAEAEADVSATTPLARTVHWSYDSRSLDWVIVCADGPAPPPAQTIEASRVWQRRMTADRAASTPPPPRSSSDNPFVGLVCMSAIDEIIGDALVDRGYVGALAPEGSVLYVELFSTHTKSGEFRGSKGTVGTTLTLVRDDVALASWRGLPIHGYRRRPRETPSGMVDPKTMDRPPEYDEFGPWLLTMLVRSAAHELESSLTDDVESSCARRRCDRSR